ncbi:MAG: DUF5671 domain-containing protein [bacterium]|nr:DUF5671 domain-containing protein [bacterium]
METQQNSTPSESKFSVGFFFLCLGVLISLTTSVVSFLNLVFSTLNKRFPDVLNSTYQYGYSTYEYEGIRSALATLIIFFPVFIIISYFWKKFAERGMGSIDEIIRKWVIYIILFLSSVVAIVDLVTLVKYFISGEITGRFILKVVAVFVVAMFVGVYYIFELKGKKKLFGFSVGIWSVIESSVLVAFVIYFSFSVMGSPAKQRLLRLDDRRVNDIQNIQYQIINFWQQKEKLPKDLTEMVNPLTGYSLPVPPEFEKGEKYEYNVLEAKMLKFELCATFALPTPKGWREYGGGGGIRPMPYLDYEQDMAISYPYPGGGTNESWDHQTGRTCFERTIDKDIYPPYKKQ